ncbi:hypothetical protein [Asanoa sp. NPDC050611]|uniref:hypothetical protein n=1 Tax=Asanoa sp. NPDC050611 TaxID=3157098 RepID=UPI0033F4C04D
MGKLRTRVGLGAAVVGIGLALSAPAYADGARFQITSPQSGSTISNSPTVRGLGTPGARVAVEAISQRNNDHQQRPGNNDDQRPGNNGDQRPGNNGDQRPDNNGDERPGNNDQRPGNNDQRPGNNGDQRPGNNGQQPGNSGQQPGSMQPGNTGQQPGNNGDQRPGGNNGNWNESESRGGNVAGTCNATVNQQGWWSCTISPNLKPGRYKIVARQSVPGAGNDVAAVDNLTVPGGQLPVTPGPDPVPVVAGGLVLLLGGAVVVAATRTRRRGKHAA